MRYPSIYPLFLHPAVVIGALLFLLISFDRPRKEGGARVSRNGTLIIWLTRYLCSHLLFSFLIGIRHRKLYLACYMQQFRWQYHLLLQPYLALWQPMDSCLNSKHCFDFKYIGLHTNFQPCLYNLCADFVIFAFHFLSPHAEQHHSDQELPSWYSAPHQSDSSNLHKVSKSIILVSNVKRPYY